MAATQYTALSTVGSQSMPDEEADESASSKTPLVQQPETPQASPPKAPRIALKLVVLIAVTLQNTAYALARRYSRGHLRETYSTSSVLLVMEAVKMVLSMFMIGSGGAPSDVPSGSALSKFVFLLRRSQKMMVPAVIYLVMNILGFVALGHIDAATFSIIAQMKVFTTATFSVLMLNRALAPRKWRALCTLVIGVVLISHESMPKGKSDHAMHERQMTEWFIGMAASLGDVILSGFVSIYFEKVLKSKTETYSVWDRNFQLAFWSMIIYMPIMIYDNPINPFAGWSGTTAVCAAVGALGGVLVALSIKLADSIMKTIATTGAIVLTTALNAVFLHGPYSLPIASGALVVIVSVFNYNDAGDPHKK